MGYVPLYLVVLLLIYYATVAIALIFSSILLVRYLLSEYNDHMNILDYHASLIAIEADPDMRGQCKFM